MAGWDYDSALTHTRSQPLLLRKQFALLLFGQPDVGHVTHLVLGQLEHFFGMETGSLAMLSVWMGLTIFRPDLVPYRAFGCRDANDDPLLSEVGEKDSTRAVNFPAVNFRAAFHAQRSPKILDGNNRARFGRAIEGQQEAAFAAD